MSVSTRKKDDQRNTNGHGARVKLRWMELDVEGGTTDLVEKFTAALTNRPITAPTRTLTAGKPSAATSTADVDSPPAEAETPADSVEAEAAEDVLSETTGVNGPDRPKRRAAPRAPKFLSDLDLTKAPVQLADFVQDKNPQGDMDKYAVIAAWFKQHLNADEITIDHVFTAYKALGWQAELPDDPSQTFRNLKSNKNWFDSGSKRGAYKINWHGESAVNKMGAAKP